MLKLTPHGLLLFGTGEDHVDQSHRDLLSREVEELTDVVDRTTKTLLTSGKPGAAGSQRQAESTLQGARQEITAIVDRRRRNLGSQEMDEALLSIMDHNAQRAVKALAEVQNRQGRR